MKRARTTCVAAGVGLLLFVLGGGSASAEWFFDLYGGAAFPMDPDLTVTSEGGTRETVRGHSDTVWTVGGRGGYWFDRGPRWLGVALDISYFEPEFTRSGGTGNVAKLKIQTIPVTPLVMFRCRCLRARSIRTAGCSPTSASDRASSTRRPRFSSGRGPATSQTRASQWASTSERGWPTSSCRTGPCSWSTGSRT